jgi:hypothetical protein
VIRLGIYSLGCRQVIIWLDPKSSGGRFDCGESITRIIIGLKGNNWAEVLNVMMHESMELVMTEMGCRHTPSPNYAADSGAYLFVMDHVQFTEATARVAKSLCDIIPDSATAFRKFKKERKES